MPQIVDSMFVLAVPNLEVTSRYFQDVLGFSVEPMGDSGWVMLQRDGCRMMVGECPDALPPRELGDHSYFGYLELDEIDAYYAQVKAAGATLRKELQDESWGMREFAIETVDGHRIMFGSVVKPQP